MEVKQIPIGGTPKSRVLLEDLKQEIKGKDGIMDAEEQRVFGLVSKMDANADGEISVVELAKMAVVQVQQKDRIKNLWRIIGCSILFFIITLATILGVVILANETTKETRANSDGRLTVNGDDDQVVKVGVNEWQFELDTSGTAATKDGQSVKVREAGKPAHPLSSLLPDEAFRELKTFAARSEGGAYLEMDVLGWVRVPNLHLTGGAYVKLITARGDIKLAGQQIMFDDVVGNLFAEAGFVLGASGRKLQGLYEVIGLFNSIPREDWLGLDPTEPVPGIFVSAYFEYTMMHPCENDPFLCSVGVEFPSDGSEDGLQGISPDLLANVGVVVNPDGNSTSYAMVDYVAWYDAHYNDGAVLEIVSHAEWPDAEIVSYQDKDKSAEGMRHKDDLGHEDWYYCDQSGFEPKPEQQKAAPPLTEEQIAEVKAAASSATWGIIRAQKTFSDANGHRTFEIDIECDELSYAMLIDDADATGYDPDAPFITITYYDKVDLVTQTTTPLKILFPAGIIMEFTKYRPDSRIDLSPGSTYTRRIWSYNTMMPTCTLEVTDDTEKRLLEEQGTYFPSKMRTAAFAANREDRQEVAAEKPLSYYGVNPNDVESVTFDFNGTLVNGSSVYNYINYGNVGQNPVNRTSGYLLPQRHLLGRAKKPDWGTQWPFSESYDFYQSFCNSGNKGTCQGSKMYKPTEIELGIGKVTMKTWLGVTGMGGLPGCGLKSIEIEGEAVGGFSPYGNCEGKTPLLCGQPKSLSDSSNNLACEIGIKFDPLAIAGRTISKIMKYIGMEAYVTLGFTYTTPDLVGIKGTGVLQLIADWWGWEFGVALKFQASGTFKVTGAQYFELDINFEGKLCFFACWSASVTIFKKRYSLGDQEWGQSVLLSDDGIPKGSTCVASCDGDECNYGTSSDKLSNGENAGFTRSWGEMEHFVCPPGVRGSTGSDGGGYTCISQTDDGRTTYEWKENAYWMDNFCDAKGWVANLDSYCKATFQIALPSSGGLPATWGQRAVKGFCGHVPCYIPFVGVPAFTEDRSLVGCVHWQDTFGRHTRRNDGFLEPDRRGWETNPLNGKFQGYNQVASGGVFDVRDANTCKQYDDDDDDMCKYKSLDASTTALKTGSVSQKKAAFKRIGSWKDVSIIDRFMAAQEPNKMTCIMGGYLGMEYGRWRIDDAYKSSTGGRSKLHNRETAPYVYVFRCVGMGDVPLKERYVNEYCSSKNPHKCSAWSLTQPLDCDARGRGSECGEVFDFERFKAAGY